VTFGAGQFAPSTTAGKRLLAHELTHIVQQSGDTFSAPLQRQLAPEIDEEAGRAGEEFRRERRQELGRLIEGMRFRKIRVDCPEAGGVQLLKVLNQMRSRVNSNRPCLRFFQENFGFGPDRLFAPNANPTITVDPRLTTSGVTRCPEPSVRIRDDICRSPLRERVIMHELTHYAGCLTRANRPSTEELAGQGEDICIGTVQEVLDATRRRQQGESPQQPASGSSPPFLQPKLIFNQPGDQYEKEADQVADKLLSGEGATFQQRMATGTIARAIDDPHRFETVHQNLFVDAPGAGSQMRQPWRADSGAHIIQQFKNAIQQQIDNRPRSVMGTITVRTTQADAERMPLMPSSV
jgi:hypothetical protein